MGPLLGNKQGLARWVEAGSEACFEAGMVWVGPVVGGWGGFCVLSVA